MPEAHRDKIVTIEIKFKVNGARCPSDAAKVIEDRLYPDTVPFSEGGLDVEHGHITNISVQEVDFYGRPRL